MKKKYTLSRENLGNGRKSWVVEGKGGRERRGNGKGGRPGHGNGQERHRNLSGTRKQEHQGSLGNAISDLSRGIVVLTA